MMNTTKETTKPKTTEMRGKTRILWEMLVLHDYDQKDIEAYPDELFTSYAKRMEKVVLEAPGYDFTVLRVLREASVGKIEC